MVILIGTLQCILFLGIPLITLVAGVLLVLKFRPELVESRWYSAALAGVMFFEGSLLGMLMDSRASEATFLWILQVSFGIGVVVTLLVYVMLPVYAILFKAINSLRRRR